MRLSRLRQIPMIIAVSGLCALGIQSAVSAAPSDLMHNSGYAHGMADLREVRALLDEQGDPQVALHEQKAIELVRQAYQSAAVASGNEHMNVDADASNSAYANKRYGKRQERLEKAATALQWAEKDFKQADAFAGHNVWSQPTLSYIDRALWHVRDAMRIQQADNH